MKNILISIKPEHCCNILNKDKILEIRTNCPTEWKKYLDGKTNIKPEPCKVCIYCTKDKNNILAGTSEVEKSWKCWNRKDWNKQEKKDVGFGKYNGKIVAKFTLNEVEEFECSSYDHNRLKETKCCLTLDEIRNYCKGQSLYGWYIDDLIIYDKPKELRGFSSIIKRMKGKESRFTSHLLERPPQSWCYVEETGEEV